METAAWKNEFNARRELFEEKFERRAEQDCWLWTAAKIAKGHGIFNLGQLTPTSSTSAYAAAWFFYVESNRDFDDAARFSHLCGNASCVNPKHLIKIDQTGLVNDRTVLEFIAHRNPSVRTALLKEAKKLQVIGNPK